MKSQIIIQKTYYLPTFIGDLRQGFLTTRTFIVSKTDKRMFLRKKSDVIEFKGRKELRKAIKGKRQLPQKADGDVKYVPKEILMLIKSARKIPLKVEL